MPIANSRFKWWFVGVVALCVVAGVAVADDLPMRLYTPGAVNEGVTQENIHSTVCVPGWSKEVRPPAYYTNKLKKEQILQYGYLDRNPRNYEEDHLIPLSIGGNPSDPRNLWPEPRKSEWNAERKDQLEFALYKAVCRGDISLAEARQAFSVNWIASYKKYEYLVDRYRNKERWAE